MTTYMVYVNQKWMVKVEVEGSMAAAEHAILDNYDGIRYAQAFDKKAMATNYYYDLLAQSDVISLKELANKCERYTALWKEAGKAKDERLTADLEVERLERLLEEAKKAQRAAERKADDTYGDAYSYQYCTMNIQGNCL